MLATGIVINLLVLGYYKYTDFLLGNINAVFGTHYALPHIVLPLAISFFTFTQIAYLVDSYRGRDSRLRFVELFTVRDIFPPSDRRADCSSQPDHAPVCLALEIDEA